MFFINPLLHFENSFFLKRIKMLITYVWENLQMMRLGLLLQGTIIRSINQLITKTKN